MTEKTDHKAAALGLLDSLHDWQGEVGATDEAMLTAAIEAQTRATLYLAEQQAAAVEQARIANLIALFHEEGPDIAPPNLKGADWHDVDKRDMRRAEQDAYWDGLRRSIREGLGL